LKYISKEDEDPLFNCPVDRLSFSFGAKFWAANTPTFSYRDPFVLEHLNKYKFLEKLHLEERERERTLCYIALLNTSPQNEPKQEEEV
jgi:hypothetical protein